MKPLFAFLAAVLLPGFGTAGEEIAYGLESGTTLLRTFVADREDSLESIVFSVDGDEVQEVEEVEDESTSVERVVVRDEIQQTEDGFPTDFRRTFVELHQQGTRSSGAEESESVAGSDFEDVTVRFLWDDEDERYDVELVEEDDGIDAEELARLTPDLDLAGLLPDGEVDEGDSWEIDHAPYLTLMWPGGLVGWYDDKTEDEASYDYSETIVDNLEGEGEVTFLEVREVDGVRVAVLSVEIRVETGADLELSEEEEEAGVERRADEERELEGEVLWDLDHGHLHSARFEATLEYTFATRWSAETPEGDEVEVEQVLHFEGAIVYTAEVERE